MTIITQGYADDFKPLVRLQVWKAGASDRRDVVALIDTGATDCTVRAQLAHDLRLVIGDKVHTHNVGGSGLKASSRIDVLFHGVDEHGDPTSLAFENARCLIDDFHPSFEMILGMNILRFGRLTLDNGIPSFRLG